jgi:UDP-glucose 4-epimerase
VALRYFNVFGPAQDPQSDYAAVIPRFIARVLEGQAPIIYGDGQQSRDFIPIDNVVAINLLAAQAPSAAGMVLNVGTGTSVTLNQLVAELGRITGQTIQPIYAEARPGDVRESLADTTLLCATLGYTPVSSFAEGLAETVHAFARDKKEQVKESKRC